MGISAGNLQSLSSALGKLDQKDNQKIDGSSLNSSKRDDLLNKIIKLDDSDSIEGNIFNDNLRNNKEFMNSYSAVRDAMKSNDTAKIKEAKDKFLDNLISADAQDDEEFNASVFNTDDQSKQELANSEQQSVDLQDIFRMAVAFDSQDDRKINGSVLDNSKFLYYLDSIDDGIINNSAQNYLMEKINADKFALENDPNAKPNNAVNAYNMFNPYDENNNAKFSEMYSPVNSVLSSNGGYDDGYMPQVYTGASSIADKEVLTNALNLAKSRLGGGTKKEYGLSPDQPWCAAFATWAVIESNNGNPFLDRNGKPINRFSCSSLVRWADNPANNVHGKDLYITKEEAVKKGFTDNVKVGDAVIFRWQKGKSSQHIGLVTKIENGKIYTIEGNASNRVKEKVYDINSFCVQGFIQLNDCVKETDKDKEKKAVA
jgi:hypothetical protein